MLGREDDFDKIMIKKAYDYMKNMLETSGKTYQTKSEITKQILTAYEKLIATITEYGFNKRWKNSYGDNQNRTNKQILSEISLLKPMLIMVLKNIDLHFNEINDITEISFFDNQLREKLEKLIEQLNCASQRLVNSETDYHVIWESTYRNKYWNKLGPATASDLGKAKLKWKSSRNNACHTILDFYREIKEINISLQSKNMTYTIDEANELYNYGIENIKRGPNYYSYLNEEERKNLTEQNILRKRKLKELSQKNS